MVTDNVSSTGPWYKEINRKQWIALGAGMSGWGLDAFDVMLYAFALTTILKEWALTTTAAGMLQSVTLFSSAIGGLMFGVIADKIGRKKSLMLTVLIFSICSGLSGLAQNVVQLALARALLGIGMGGEWGTGALLISESWPAKHRGKAIGLMQGGWAIGYILAAIVAGIILPVYGWRVLFVVGILPALFTVWIRKYVEEPVIWVKSREVARQTNQENSMIQIFRPDLIRYTLIISLVSSFVMFAYWGLFSWLPGFLSTPVDKGGAGLSLVRSSGFMVGTMIGAFFGYVSFGFIADKIGRRPTFSGFLIISAVVVYIYGQTRDPQMLMWMGPLVGFFGSGYFSGFGAFISEMFPTRARGAGVGFTYNVGRTMSAMAPTVVGYFATTYGLGGSLMITAGFFFLGAISIFLLPETMNKELE
ncbi:MAG TPA: MFS transporter [Patescibacteria group bacterium]|nr:MFS transporter [Patescibacteria group bacterium]